MTNLQLFHRHGIRTADRHGSCASATSNVNRATMVKANIWLLGLCLACFATPAVAQSVGGATSDGIPMDIRLFGPPDPNVRKASAIVNGSIITDLDVEHRLSLVVAASGGRISPEERNRLRVQVLRNLIDERLQVLEAKEHEVTVEDAEVQSAFARVARNFNQTPEQFAKFLKQQGSSDDTLKEQIRAELAWTRLLRRRVAPFVTIGDEEVDAVIKRLEASKGQEEYRVSELFLTATSENEAAVRNTAERILDQVRKGASFVAYARQFSEASTAAVGGDLGYVMAEQLPAPLQEAVKNLKVGEISEPIRVPGGFSLILLADKRKVLGPDPLDAVLTIKQVIVPLKSGSPEAELRRTIDRLAAEAAKGGGCGRAEAMAQALGGRVDTPEPQPLRAFPQGLHPHLERLQVGEATRPFGTEEDARVVVLCGRDDAKEAKLPSYDEIYAQLNEERMSRMARRYLRDLRRDAIIDYR